ncbi:MAG: DUF1292 domain-containing protein [Clostridiales bacterium]|jgi:uncharacterized protein YrzB (UPF0473 family)|nr:DUF1292 domain-containing protein [Clostridiales bacterium]
MKKDEKKDLDIETADDLDGIDIVTLYDEDLKKEVDFEQVAAINYKEKLYVFLTPVEPNDDIGEGEVIIMEVADDTEGEETLLPITDETLLNEIFEEFQKELADYDEECDCEDCHAHKEHDCGCGCDECKE